MQPSLRISWDPETWRVSLVPDDAVSAMILSLMKKSPNSLFRVVELSEELEETDAKIRDGLGHLLDTDRIVKTKAKERGERGFTYRLKTGDDDEEGEGGLSID
jgi:hypothetical protein